MALNAHDGGLKALKEHWRVYRLVFPGKEELDPDPH
jgi:hypothetical protein